VQELSAVRDWNCWLSVCASLPFCTLKPDPDPDPEADDVAADDGTGDAASAAAAAEDGAEDGAAGVGESDAEEGAAEGVDALPLPLAAPVPEGTPGDETRSVSCDPAAIGPEVCAGQLPGGFKMAVWPNGIVPGAPAATPPVNWVRLAPWNWHWKSPLSSGFFGACWQYCTLRESGVLRGCCAKI